MSGHKGEVQLGRVCVLLNNQKSLDDELKDLADEAAARISTTPQAKEKLHALFLHYMNRAAEAAKKD